MRDVRLYARVLFACVFGFGFNLSTNSWHQDKLLLLSSGSISGRSRGIKAKVVLDARVCVVFSVFRFNFSTSAWHQVNASGRVPRARYRATCVVHSACMYLFGGHDGTRHLNDVHVYDFEVSRV